MCLVVLSLWPPGRTPQAAETSMSSPSAAGEVGRKKLLMAAFPLAQDGLGGVRRAHAWSEHVFGARLEFSTYITFLRCEGVVFGCLIII